MDEERASQECGHCGTLNAADAVVCESCGVVLAAYASTGGSAVEPEAEPAPSASESDQPTHPTPLAPGQGWRALFERPGLLPTEETTPTKLAEKQIPPEATAAVVQGIEGGREQRSATAEATARSSRVPPPDVPPVPTGSRAVGVAASQPEQARRRVSDSSRPVSPQTTGAANVKPLATTRLDPKATKRLLRIQLGSPLWIMYAGIALLLGGCVLSLILAMVIENSTAIGFAFLCTVPIGFVLLVVGYVQLLMRREGRAPKK